MMHAIARAIVLNIGVSSSDSILENHILILITEGKHVARFKAFRQCKYFLQPCYSKRFYDTAANAAGTRTESNSLKLQAVVSQTVRTIACVKALNKVCRRTLSLARAVPVFKIAGPCKFWKHLGTLRRIAYNAISQRLHIAP